MTAQLSNREKTLSVLVGVIVFLLITFFLADAFLKSKARIEADLAAKTRQLKTVRMLSAEENLWEQRDAWLRLKQPPLANADSAGVLLLDHVRALAKKYSVLLDSPVIRPPAAKPDFTAIGVEIETKSSWAELVAFLRELQTPEEFIALDSANLKIDAADPTQMRGKFKIARWCAPGPAR